MPRYGELIVFFAVRAVIDDTEYWLTLYDKGQGRFVREINHNCLTRNEPWTYYWVAIKGKQGIAAEVVAFIINPVPVTPPKESA